MRRAPLLLLLAGLLTAPACGPDAEEFLDADGDGAPDWLDCAPEDAEIRDGVLDPHGDGVDQNCDGADGMDGDGDGRAANAPGNPDCDDGDPDVHPGATEVPHDGVDQDCDGLDYRDADADGSDDDLGDCDPTDAALNDLDADGDGQSTCDGDCDDDDPTLQAFDLDGDGASLCSDPPDCDDSDPGRAPGIEETCDGVDQDCDGVLPDDEADDDTDGYAPCTGDCDDDNTAIHPADTDGDGYSLCSDEPDCDDEDATLTPDDVDFDGLSACDGDCDDNDATVRPGAPEVCNGVDDDCFGGPGPDEVDDDGDGALACADCNDDNDDVAGLDDDGDGFDPCTGDCDEADPLVRPDAPDPWGDALDDNCDGVDGTDLDGDGFPGDADPGDPTWDCDDLLATLDRADADGDGVDTCGGDCDDDDPTVGPAAVDPWGDGVDQDCDGSDGLDADGDGFPGDADPGDPTWDCDDGDATLDRADSDADGVDSCAGDCDDDDAARFPGNSEASVCDGLDQDCVVDPSEADLDGDGSMACAGDCDDDDPLMHGLDVDGDGASLCDGDCDDDDFTVSPFAADPWGDGEDPNCDGVDGIDADGDGYAGNEFPADLSNPNWDCDDDDAAAHRADSDGDGLDSCSGDCDDDDALTHPDLWDPSDLVDRNCDGFGTTSLGWASLAMLHGATGNESAGYSVAAAGDVDGDGLGDLLVGAPFNEALGERTGIAYVVLAADLGLGGDLSLADAHASFQADAAGAMTGWSVAGAGDVDGDGLDDLLIGAPSYEEPDDPPGEAALFFGASLGTPGPRSLSEADVRFLGGDEELLGWVVSSAGDVDGDGLADVVLTAPLGGEEWEGAAYVFFGSSLQYGGDFTPEDADAQLVRGSGYWGDVAQPTAAAGDIDGDGLDDLVSRVGQPGDIAIVFGDELQYGGDIDMSDREVLITDFSSFANEIGLGSAGDVDGDGLDDLVIGDPYFHGPPGPFSGRAMVFTGATLSGGGEFWVEDADYLVEGASPSQQFGAAVSGVGDVDGDGLDDFTVGAPQATYGLLFFFSGADAAAGGEVDTSAAAAAFHGDSGNPSMGGAGRSLAGPGDVDGDGRPDLLIGTDTNPGMGIVLSSPW